MQYKKANHKKMRKYGLKYTKFAQICTRLSKYAKIFIKNLVLKCSGLCKNTILRFPTSRHIRIQNVHVQMHAFAVPAYKYGSDFKRHF